MLKTYNRRKFLKASATAGIGLSLAGSISPFIVKGAPEQGKRVGIIGLDTSHVIHFTEDLNLENVSAIYKGE